MMRERKKSLERLVAVKTQLHGLEEARLAEIERRKAAARQDRDAMIGLLDRAVAPDGLLMALACKRAAAAERGAAHLEAQAVAQRQAVARHRAQKRNAENMLREAAVALAREEEKQALLDIAEKAAAKSASPPTSLP